MVIFETGVLDEEDELASTEDEELELELEARLAAIASSASWFC
jgi:hypothetical protein